MSKFDQRPKHNPLSESYIANEVTRVPRNKKRKSISAEDDGEAFVDAHASRKILRLGRDLAEEDEFEQKQRDITPPRNAFTLESRFGNLESDTEEKPITFDDDEAWGHEEEEVEEEDAEIDLKDLEAFNKFNPSVIGDDPIHWPSMGEGNDESQEPGVDLATLIMEKIVAHEAGKQQRVEGEIGSLEGPIELPEKVVDVYSQVGLILSRYKSGPLPKPFKLLPTLPIPQQGPLISLTRPELWTPNAVYEATRLFISRAPAVAQAYCSEILLPAVRDDIRETRKLNVHLYKALKKSLYKPAAFFKGLIFPLLLEGCSLREAQIVSSVVARVSIPVLHSAAALQRICEIASEQMSGREGVNGAGAANLFIRVLLEKKYALPYKVVDAVVFHFLRFRIVAQGMEFETGLTKSIGGKEDDLPVIWHQSLLAFAQRYRNDVTEDQREALLDVVNSRGHRLIGPEIRRELLAGRGRGIPMEVKMEVSMGGDDTMIGVSIAGVEGTVAGQSSGEQESF